MLRLLCFLLHVCQWASSTASSAAEHPWEKDYRLPKHVVPEVYNILLYPNLKEDKFSGTVDILLNITSPTDYVVLHSKDLTIPKTILTAESSDGENLVKNAFAYPKNDFWVLELKEQVNEGKYKIKLDFSGILTTSMFGLYKSVYKDATSGQNRSIATTQFEATYARQAVPCFDEPCFKSIFNVKLVRPSEGNYIALSNMNQESETADTPSKGLTTVTFAKSVPMPTYLTCFIVCDFKTLASKKCDHGFDVAVYARSGQINKMEYALQTAVSAIDFFIEYFGMEYPLPKLDLIAIPDFSSGAMENWGLVTFRETSVLYDPNYSTGLNLLQVTSSIVHELAHMFFGNLVTMLWWDDLWLKEGFATFMSYIGSTHIHPDWDLDTVFIWYELTTALGIDSTLSSHPIVRHVAHPDHISEIFDSISYSKAASVLRMMESFLGEENFKKGVSSYLKTFAFKNAETKDLMHHLQKFASGVNVERVMDTWTKQMGCPVLIVVQNGDTITVTQKRFLNNKNSTYDPTESPYKYKWDVPVTCLTSENKEPTLKWLLIEDASVNINIGDVKWYKLNFHFKGFYRVSYPLENWKALAAALEEDNKVLDARDRLNVMEDAFALAESGNLDYSIPLTLAKFLKNEADQVVMAEEVYNLLKIDKKLQNTEISEDYRNYLKTLFASQLSKESLWDFSSNAPESNPIQRYLKVRLINMACKFEIPEHLNKVKQLFIDWLENNGTKPDVNVQYIVYNYGIAQSGEEQWNKLWDRFLKETDPQERVRIRTALSYTTDEKLIKKYIELSKSEHNMRSQDYFYVLDAIAENPKVNHIIWDWYRSNWNYLVERFTLNNRNLGTTLETIVANYATNEKLKELEQFLADNPEEGATADSRKSAVETIKNNMAWLNLHYATLTKFLKTEQ